MKSPFEFPVASFPDHRAETFVITATPEEVGLTELDDDTRIVSPIRAECEVFRQGHELYVTMNVSADAELVCGRCLCPIETTLDTTFKVLYRPIAQRPNFWEDEEEIGLGYYEGSIINVCEEIRRYLLLEMPFWSLCREDCAGLCYQCGANLNVESCSCAEKKGAIDKRTRFGDALLAVFSNQPSAVSHQAEASLERNRRG